MKEKILNQARLLYNEMGLSKVTARLICEELNISLGSFSYHFPNKNGIIESLYQQILAENAAILNSFQPETPTILTYLETQKGLFLVQERYKFFFLNLFEILTHYKNIEISYIQNSSLERERAKNTFNSYIEYGIIKRINDKQMNELLNIEQILHNFWIVDAQFAPNDTKEMNISHYMKVSCTLLETFLTHESKMIYEHFFNELGE